MKNLAQDVTIADADADTPEANAARGVVGAFIRD